MACRIEPIATLEDLHRLEGSHYKYELCRGHPVREPPPGGRHGRIASSIVYALESHVRKTGCGVVLTCDTWFVLKRHPDTVRGPDIAYVSGDRYRALRDESRPIPGPPDLAVEVLSPGNRRAEIDAKVADYLTAGTVLVWIVDPETHTVSIHAANAAPLIAAAGDVLSAPQLLPGFELMLSDLF